MQYNCYLIYFVPMLVPLFNKLIGLGNLIHNIGYLLHRIISNCILYLLYPFERFFFIYLAYWQIYSLVIYIN